MGIIHLAEARGPGGFEKLVVVKELKRELTDDPVYTSMFLDEARLAARLTHRHIVQTNEVGYEAGRYFMALELLEGGSLHQVCGKVGLRALPFVLGARVLVAVLEALHHAHDLSDNEGRPMGIVHRDVTPQNVFLTFDGDVKLIDFGVAKSKDRRADAAATRVGVVKGSIPYMSPDHVDGSTIDRRADVFAVGIILRELLTGERLWGDADDLTMLRALIARNLPAFPGGPDVPPELRAIAERAMAPHRGDRYATAAAMRDALQAYLEEVDPRGSLDDLGVWLGKTLKDERAAFAALVRRSRSGAQAITPKAATANTLVWLPSDELVTRFSGPPAIPVPEARPLAAPLPAAAPQPPRVGSAHGRFLRAGAVFAAALAVVTLAFAQPRTSADASSFERAPRAVEDTVTVSVARVAGAAPAEPEEQDASEEATALSERAFREPTAASTVPASVLREALPPNPYEAVD